MTLEQFLNRVRDGQQVEFEQTMSVIEASYKYTPSRFSNGCGARALVSEAGENAGSCKIFAFATDQGLDQQQTLQLFGRYYREDVLQHPQGQDHMNIRNFIIDGWDGIRFDAEPLQKR